MRKQLPQDDREWIAFFKGKRNPSTYWYHSVLSKTYGTDKIAAAVDVLHSALCAGIDKLRGRHKKHTRLVSPTGDVVNDFTVKIGEKEIRLRNDRSRGLHMEADASNLQWLLTTLHDLCEEKDVPGISIEQSTDEQVSDKTEISKEDRCRVMLGFIFKGVLTHSISPIRPGNQSRLHVARST